MIKDVLAKLAERESLAFAETAQFIDAVADGQATEAQIAAFLIGLRAKGESVAEIAGCVAALRRRALAVPHHQSLVFDCCGTGGDGTGTFNISTAASLVVAACGVPTAKHGNRAVSSSCGSADLLEAAGADIELSPDRAAQLLDDLGYVFLFAPAYHPAAKRVAGVRRELGIRTVFNLIGPLLNPARATHQMIGAATRPAAAMLAAIGEYLPELNVTTLHNSRGYDELLPLGVNHRYRWLDGALLDDEIELPVNIHNGFPATALRGGDKDDNVRLLRGILSGADSPLASATDLNAAFGLVIAGHVENLAVGVELALDARRSGRALRLLDDYIHASREEE